jgi:hypothetical protein
MIKKTKYQTLVEAVTAGTSQQASEAIKSASVKDLRTLEEEYDLDSIAECFDDELGNNLSVLCGQTIERKASPGEKPGSYSEQPTRGETGGKTSQANKHTKPASETTNSSTLDPEPVEGPSVEALSETPAIDKDGDPTHRHLDALATLGQRITDEQLGKALAATESTGRDYLRHCILTGALLSAAKAATPHGEWRDRVEGLNGKMATRGHFDSYRSVRRYMRLWLAFATDWEAGLLPVAKGVQPALTDALATIADGDGLADLHIAKAVDLWIGEEGTLRGLLTRLNRADIDAHRDEDEAPRDDTPKDDSLYDPQQDFYDRLLGSKTGILSSLKSIIQDEHYNTLPKSQWQTIFGEIHPVYEEIARKAGVKV